MDNAAETPVDINAGIESTLKMFSNRLKHGIEVKRDYADLPRICAHGAELNQVWTNLIDNACDTMEHRGGTLGIRTALKGNCVNVEISDTGPGIPDEIRSRIFEPFFTTKPQGQGTGLGLDIVFRIVRRHQGDIRFESRPGATCFQVSLPARQPGSGS
jgi:signal transduction histidine kinase